MPEFFYRAIKIVAMLLLFGSEAQSSPLKGRADVFSGVDIAGSSASTYAGFLYAPFGLIEEGGIILKTSFGVGKYQYESGSDIIDGQYTSADIMVGYVFQLNAWYTKTYFGIHHIDHKLLSQDPGNSVQGSKVGVKAQFEVWKRFGDKSWFSGNLSYSSGFGDYWGQGGLGFDVSHKLSTGIEAAMFGNRNYSAGRLGAFARVKTQLGDVTLSGGVGGNQEEAFDPYFSISFYRRF